MSKRSVVLIALAALMILLPSTTLRAEVQVVWERVEPAAATANFQFQKIPAPSQSDAGTNARIQVVDGREDPLSGDLDVLHDGQLPADQDFPDGNYYFEAATAGGRLTMDLGKPTEIQQVNTYSWHTGARAPQVYRLYASSAAAPPPATHGANLEQAGWKLLATVDTRPKEGSAAGQYGVSVSVAGGGALGAYRFLLFDVARTTEVDRFDNTFFSEIDVLDGKQYAAAPRDPADVEIVFDVSEVPALKPWVDAKLRPACKKWYPIIARLLESNGYSTPRHFTVVFDKDMQGVAETLGTRVRCGGAWMRQNLEGEAVGAVIHELVHVVQHYGRVRGGNPNPVWLIEGVADYIRWFQFEPEALRPRPDPALAKYTDGYRSTAAFLNYLVEKRDPKIVQKLNETMRTGRYSGDVWKQLTGKSVDELWDEYVKTLAPPAK